MEYKGKWFVTDSPVSVEDKRSKGHKKKWQNITNATEKSEKNFHERNTKIQLKKYKNVLTFI